MKITLVNTNRIKPPITPVGIDYIAEALYCAGYRVSVLDLCWSSDPDVDIQKHFANNNADLVGVSIRNTDDCVYTSRESFFGIYGSVIGAIKRNTDAPIVLGGIGFSTMPRLIMEKLTQSGTPADYGIRGEGEFAFVALANALDKKDSPDHLPGLLFYNGETLRENPMTFGNLDDLPILTRRWADNKRYFEEGGQAGFETSRGCGFSCIYCAEPAAKGTKVRLKDAEKTALELNHLHKMKIDHFHTCDSEFNVDEKHAKAVCSQIIAKNLGNHIRWYAYCTPAGFSKDLALYMARAGCAGINFGVDSGDPGMLDRLKRGFSPADIKTTATHCKNAGIAVMFDLLFGAPGETEKSVRNTINLMKQCDIDCVGIACGIRLYPESGLGLSFKKENRDGIKGGPDPVTPVFYMEPSMVEELTALLHRLIGGEERFLFYDPSMPDRNYNYNTNQRLSRAIEAGHRGAYWDILRKIK